MSHDAATGFILGLLISTGMAIAIRDQGRDACDQKLPRDEKCVQIWVPEKDAAQAAAKGE
ncbi:hypothetical protein [Delftia sp. PS-11]|uniref:hypothetical protein n=1 Tax=Delftia sp. PS-11 TaxID=2767222 RepID=UPI002454AAEF|nr:hypothetical protein [Delftia sp. PS-11]KAJ8740685.1 hypothetical protein H9T68_23485 [Delftia sp. PS-11]